MVASDACENRRASAKWKAHEAETSTERGRGALTAGECKRLLGRRTKGPGTVGFL